MNNLKKYQFKFLLPMQLLWLFVYCNFASAMGEDDPLLTKVMVDQLEVSDTEQGKSVAFSGQAWAGKDLHKFWLKADAEKIDNVTDSAELQLLYNRSIAAFWDLQLGFKRDFKPAPDRSWAVIGLNGLAPYSIDVGTVLFVGESSRTGFRLQAAKEWLLNQRLILTPEIELNFFAHNDDSLGVGSGLSDMDVGLRLRYEVRREFAPYIGVHWLKSFGNTARIARDSGDETEDINLIAGITFWF